MFLSFWYCIQEQQWQQVSGVLPGYMHMRSSPRPEPEPSSLDSEMDDSLSLTELARAPEHASVSLGCLSSIHRYIQQQRYTRYVHIICKCNVK